jgi:hypothetical protein
MLPMMAEPQKRMKVCNRASPKVLRKVVLAQVELIAAGTSHVNNNNHIRGLRRERSIIFGSMKGLYRKEF